jgi:hypothetical protein
VVELLLLLLTALVAVWAGARVLLGYGARDPAHVQLSAREARFFAAAADAAFPPGGAPDVPEGQAPATGAMLPSGTEAGVVAHLDGWLALLPRRNRALIRLLVLFFEHATLAFPAPGPRGRRRFTALAPEQRIALLDDWGRSRLRLRRIVFASLRTLLTSSYFASPAVLRATGLAPLAFETPVVEADLLYPAVGRPRTAIRWRPEDVSPSTLHAPLDPHGPLHPDYAERR